MRMRLTVALCLLTLGCADVRAKEWNERGLAAERARNFSVAQAAYAEAVRANPDSARYRTNLAHMLARNAFLQQAVDEYRAALRIDPGYTDASRGLEIVSRALAQRSAERTAAAVGDELQN